MPDNNRHLALLRECLHDKSRSIAWLESFRAPCPTPFSVQVFDLDTDILDALVALDFVREFPGANLIPQKWIHTLDLSHLDIRERVFLATDFPTKDSRLLKRRETVFPYPDEGCLIISKFHERFLSLPPGARVLDLCCGMGTVSVLLAKLRPDIQITACDNSERAMQFTELNFQLNGLPNSKISLRRGDLWEAVAGEEKFDLIVADPPFSLKPKFVGQDGIDDGGEFGDHHAKLVLDSAAKFLRTRDSELLLLAYSIGCKDSKHLRVNRYIPPSLSGSFSLAGTHVLRFEHKKALRNPMPLEYLILRLGDKTRAECIVERPPDDQIEIISQYTKWIEELMQTRVPDRSRNLEAATHLHYLVGEFCIAGD